jgi:hypothetical protein
LVKCFFPDEVKGVQSDTSYLSGTLDEARMVVLRDIGDNVPMIPILTFLEKLAPLQPNFDLIATMESLRSGFEPALTRSNRWSKFAKAPKDNPDNEDTVFSPMPEIFTKVVAAIAASSKGRLNKAACTVDFLQKPNHAPISAGRPNESRPDGYLVLKNRSNQASNDENIQWAEIALSCEYKKRDIARELNDVRIHQGL